jgi:acyl-CoA synthetase (AMP-forming)/AMP-acid ligase II/3-hydroxymyristoyl/3-hydroxydecanoyl-(acyl carrier protein) dehydratase
MTGLLDSVAALPSGKPLFATGTGFVTAGQIRKTATAIGARFRGDSTVFLHTASAALFVAGLLAASRKRLPVCFPAHLQPHYLGEIGVGTGILLTDMNVAIATAIPISLAHEEEAPAPNAQAEDLHLIFFTSGVTGAPKKVPKRISQLDREAQTLEQVWGKQAGHTFATVSHQHIYGMLFRIFWPLAGGRVSQDISAEYWESLSGKLSAQTTLISSPAHLTRLPGAEVLKEARPGQIFSAGALLPFAAAQETRHRLGSVPIEVLGSTETGGIGWRQQAYEGALWTPLPGVDVTAREDGAMMVTSPFIAGDLAMATGDSVECMGTQFRLGSRVDRVVKIDGRRVSLNRVEDALLTLPGVMAAAAVDLPSRKGGLGAIVELGTEGKAALHKMGAFRLSRHLRAALAQHLEPGERPKHWRFEAIPTNAQGKRVRTSLRALFDRQPPEGIVVARSEESAEISLALPPNMIWFAGHFPGQPVLPGIVQVHLAAQWAAYLWDWKPQTANLSQLKFRQILRPKDRADLLLTRDMTRQRLVFAYRIENIVASQGVIGGVL